MNKFVKVAAAMVLATGAMLGPQMATAQDEMRIGTASLGGAYYPMGQALSNSINEFADGYTMVPIVTGGGAENPRLIASGEVEIAIAPASLSYFAHNGKGPYPEALDIRAIGTLHSSILHMVTLPGSGIESIEDLRGKRVAVGPAGGGTLNILRDLLGLHDMTLDDITPSFVSYSDGFSQLTDGAVDASFALAGFPTGAVVQAQAMNELSFIELSDEKMAELLDTFPYYSQTDVPTDVYGTDAPINVIASANLLIAPAAMTDELAFTIAEAIYENMDALIAETALAAKIVPENSLSLPIPLHPGAAAYFEARN
ncbi:TAXI family TRAP transporter solute-binding subunit [Octadecabacter sp. 1_MG-2023]|uniref:TAXI family TRAP transporter solute-binding subunit n=1 Tax=unclassified Octadecabacter TaxID=196158 RepID=UPI001C093510|nr:MULTISPECIES: TAXI family TRAP transporter solute-binding subunit [unclassified Octadecabacter]MBU2993365.1 TAXI family TRAP transporter solute-binding subunit [Octadecabacter sp. B2R22]MDO6733179.1 TAXI family TRAP transporter solute-binding subunit [Octadecabacter sp. 1_MG-2023]